MRQILVFLIAQLTLTFTYFYLPSLSSCENTLISNTVSHEGHSPCIDFENINTTQRNMIATNLAKQHIGEKYCKDIQCNDPNNSCPENFPCKATGNAIINNQPTWHLEDCETPNGRTEEMLVYKFGPNPAYCECKCLDDNNCTPDDGQNFDKSSVSDTCSDLVKLSNFTAKPTEKGIMLNWITKAELNSQGFKMWRAIPKLNSYCGCSGNIKDYIQIQVLDKEGKPILIPAKGNETSGFDYSYLDKGAKPGIAYCYALEDVDSRGESKFYFEYVAFTQDNLKENK
jgi:hypothetical protein